MPGAVCKRTERDHGFNVAAVEQGAQPTISIAGDLRVVAMLVASSLAEDAVEECVHHHVAVVDAELGQEALDAMSGLTDQDAAEDRLVLGRVLSQDEHACASVESAAMEDRSPLQSEVGGWVDRCARSVGDKGAERLSPVARGKGTCHGGLLE